MENPNLPTNINQSLMLSENDLDIDIIRYLRPQTNESVNEHPDIDSTQLISSGLNSNIVVNQGFIRSGTFVDGSSGWKIEANGDAQLNNLTLTGGTINYGKTSFTDSTNAGYFISSSGVYFGSASDATKFKYTISSGDVDVIGGTITGGIIQTSATGERIKLSSVSASKIEMLNGNTVIGYMEVDYDSGTEYGYLKIEDGNGSGLEVTSDVGASSFGSVTLESNGGYFSSAGTSSVSEIGMFAASSSKYVKIGKTGGSTYALSTDLPLAMGSNKITGLATPSATTDAANKSYVDGQISTVNSTISILQGQVNTMSGTISTILSNQAWILTNCC